MPSPVAQTTVGAARAVGVVRPFYCGLGRAARRGLTFDGVRIGAESAALVDPFAVLAHAVAPLLARGPPTPLMAGAPRPAPGFGARRAEADFGAMHQLARVDRPPDEAARGGRAAEGRGRKWSYAGTRCPHCAVAKDTLFHRVWLCPRWAHHQMAAAGLHRAALPASLADTGALRLNLWLDATRRTRERIVLLAPSVGELHAARCWTDGSAVHPACPLLRCAAWLVVWWAGTRWRALPWDPIYGPC